MLEIVQDTRRRFRLSPNGPYVGIPRCITTNADALEIHPVGKTRADPWEQLEAFEIDIVCTADALDQIEGDTVSINVEVDRAVGEAVGNSVTIKILPDHLDLATDVNVYYGDSPSFANS